MRQVCEIRVWCPVASRTRGAMVLQRASPDAAYTMTKTENGALKAAVVSAEHICRLPRHKLGRHLKIPFESKRIETFAAPKTALLGRKLTLDMRTAARPRSLDRTRLFRFSNRLVRVKPVSTFTVPTSLASTRGWSISSSGKSRNPFKAPRDPQAVLLRWWRSGKLAKVTSLEIYCVHLVSLCVS
jgi:hypothetical protein